MCSQRRHITDVEIYGRNAERFLSLRPVFANTATMNNNNTQSKQVHVTFDQGAEPNERYERTFAAYLEVRGSVCRI